jgi:leucyl aminopeptidase
MPGGKAYKPGDIIHYSNGKTVEIISTDAEGRLILADGLIRAGELDPRYVVDIATLTGGAKWTFGTQCAAVLGNDGRLINALIRSGQASHERLWQLPLWPDIADRMKGDAADLKNSGGRMSSTITASYFLSNFVSYPWAHIDIAGMAWSNKSSRYVPKGGTGFGVRLLVQWLSGLKAR